MGTGPLRKEEANVQYSTDDAIPPSIHEAGAHVCCLSISHTLTQLILIK